MDNETLRVIARRRSIRRYTDEPVAEEMLEAIVTAGQYAPHAGDQAWHFTVVLEAGLRERLNRAAKTAAREQALAPLRALGADTGFHCLYHAPALVIVSADTAGPVPLEADCMAATQTMLLAAESLGLGSCWIFFVLLAFDAPDGPALRAALRIPDGYRPHAAAIVGHPAETRPAPPRKPGRVTWLREQGQ